jgi:TIR domain
LDKHDMVAGTIQDQVWRAIQTHHAVILVLSEDSIKSDWVENELDMARRKEKDEGRAVLCPVTLDDAWKAMVNAGDGPGHPSRVLWRTLQQKLVMDFSAWKTEAFDEEFGKLVRGLRVNYGPQTPPPP